MTLLIVIRLFIIIVGFPLLFIKMIIVVMTCSLERGVWPRISEAGAITWESCIYALDRVHLHLYVYRE